MTDLLVSPSVLGSKVYDSDCCHGNGDLTGE